MTTTTLPLRINVVGSSGSGKSTTARLIADRLNVPYIEIDALFWKPNWTESTETELNDKLTQTLAAEAWVLDGNYARTVPIKWQRAQMIVWLDLPYWLIMYQVITRTLRRSLQQEELWSGHRESLWKAFIQKDSVIYWSLTNLSRIRRRYLKAMEDPQFAHLQFIRLRSRGDVRHFLDTLAPENTGKNHATDS